MDSLNLNNAVLFMKNLKKKIDKFLADFQAKHGFHLAWFIRYALGGTATVIVEYAAMYLLLMWTLPWDAIVGLLPQRLRAAAAGEVDTWALVVSNILSYIFNYFISKYWVFRSPQTKHRRDASLFMLSCVINLVLVSVSGKLMFMALELVPLSGKLWKGLVPAIAKTGSNVVAYISVLIFKRFIIWNDVSKY